MIKKVLIFVLIPIAIGCNGSAEVNDADRLPDEDKVAEDGVDMENDPPADTVEEFIYEQAPTPSNDTAGVEAIPQQPSHQEQIIGRWEWDHTVCCGRTPRTIRDTAEVPTYLQFTEEGKMLILTGEETVAEYDFEVGEGKIYPNRPYIEIMNYGIGPALLSIENGNRLVLNFGYVDAQTEFYNKVE